MGDHRVDRRRGDQAKIDGPGHGACGMAREFGACRVQLELPGTAFPRTASRAGDDDLHAENAGMEVARRIYVANGQDGMVDMADLHAFPATAPRAGQGAADGWR